MLDQLDSYLSSDPWYFPLIGGDLPLQIWKIFTAAGTWKWWFFLEDDFPLSIGWFVGSMLITRLVKFSRNKSWLPRVKFWEKSPPKGANDRGSKKTHIWTLEKVPNWCSRACHQATPLGFKHHKLEGAGMNICQFSLKERTIFDEDHERYH